MSKFSEITQVLKKIEQGRFQLACIDYLKNNVGGIVHSPGTVDDKEKTRKSHPDIYLKQPDGNYVLAECTTKDDSNQAEFIKKLKGDLKDCLDFEKIKMPQEKIARIYLCCNATIEPNVYEELENIACPYNIKVIVVGIHELASYFSGAGKVFAKDTLGVAFQTGQILNKDEFLAQYGKKNISTPLDNPLIGREQELQALGASLERNQIVILSGPPGVGKSRLAIEAIDKFTREHPNYNAFYIFSKTGEITDDLATFLKPGKAYVLLVDDANRQIDNLISILEKLIESEIKLKVVLTVRDYARADVERQVGKLDKVNFLLYKLADEKIEQIISSEPFSINNWKITERIRQISNGNPRLAIMAANVVATNSDISMLSDVTRIYDEYFQSVLSDKSLFDDKKTRQILGLIAYFNTLDITEELDRAIIEDFGLDVIQFFDIALELQDMEVLEIYDNSVVKISEQVLSTYFFFSSFFRDNILSFEKLLQVYFRSHFHRVRDAVLGAVNAFGPDKIITDHATDWAEFWDSIVDDEVLTVQFLQIFGAYFHSKIFELVNRNMLHPLEESKVSMSLKTITKAANISEREPSLELLKELYKEDGVSFETAVYLAFKYALKDGPFIARVAEEIAGALFIDSDEFEAGFKKLEFVYNFLKEHFAVHPFYRMAFYYIFDRVIISATGREALYELNGEIYKLKVATTDLRARFFKDLEDRFDVDYELIFELLLSYSTEKYDLSHLEVIADIPFMLNLLGRLNPGTFGDCYVVQKYRRKVEKATGERTDEIEKLAARFRSDSYLIFEKLYIKHDYLEDWDVFHKRKIASIETSVEINSLSDWQVVEEQLLDIYQFIGDANVYGDGVSIVLRGVLTKDMDLGFECLKSYLQKDNFLGLYGMSVFGPIMSHSSESTKRLFMLIEETTFKYQSNWFRDFFDYLPEDYLDLEYVEKFIVSFKKQDRSGEIYAQALEKFERFGKGTIERILKVLIERRSTDDKYIYKLAHDFFKKSPLLVADNTQLCKQLYFQQQSMPITYDNDGKELFILIEKDNAFFYEYLDALLEKKGNHDAIGKANLSRVWSLAKAEELVYNALLKIARHENAYTSDHLGGMFFYGIKEAQMDIFHRVFTKLVDENSHDSEVMNLLIDTLRNAIGSLYMPVFSELLDKNRDFSFFKTLQLHNNHFSSNSYQIWPEARAKELQQIIDMIIVKPMKYVYFEHLTYLNDRLERERRSAKRERKLMFRGYW